MDRKPYPSDLTDGQWEELAPLIPPAKPGGHPRTVDMREVINGIPSASPGQALYVLRSGCTWRMMPPRSPTLEYSVGIPDTIGAGGEKMALGNVSMMPCVPE